MIPEADIDRLRAALRERAGDVAEALLGEPTSRTHAELRWGRRGSLALRLSGDRRGLWHDHERGEGGDLLALIRRERRCGFPEAVRFARGLIGEPPPQRPAPPPRPQPEPREADTERLALAIWREAVPAAGTVAERYLAARGLRLPEPPDDAPWARAAYADVLRFHPACPRGPERLPAMLALMTCPHRNVPVGVHRTFLRADGTDRLRDERGKAMLGRAGVIRLTPDDEVTLGVGLTEGIETGLAVIQRLGWRPIWVATSAGAIGTFPVLAGIQAVTIFADCDAAGQRAAETCARRWAEAGREAVIATPPKGDWADPPRAAA